MEIGTAVHKSGLSSEEKESLSKVGDAFSHLEWSSKSVHITNEDSKQKGLQTEHDGFEKIPLEETGTSSASAGNSSRSVQIHHIEPAENHSSLASVHSSPESEASGSGTNFQGGQLSNDTSAQDEHEVDDTKVEPNSEIPRDAEAGDADAAATAAEWSDNNSDVFLSDTHTPSSSTPSSPPKFDEDILEAGMVGTRSQLTELKI
jgi:hypothetical protein